MYDIGNSLALPRNVVEEHGKGEDSPLEDTPEPSLDLRSRIMQKHSPHQDSRGNFRPEVIIMHRMQGSLAGCDSWFANPASQVSAHYGLGQNGEIHQYVDETRRAWHAGWARHDSVLKQFHPDVNQNRFTIGIEHEGRDNEPWSETMRATSAVLIQDIAARWNIPIDSAHIVPHRACTHTACPGPVEGMVEDIIRRAQEVNIVIPPPQPNCEYIIRAGDWLYRIAELHDLSLEALLALNPQIDRNSTIFEGQTLRVC